MKQLFFLVSFLLAFQCCVAQTNIDFGLHAGLSVYSGDLSPQPAGFSFDDLGYTGGAFFRFQFASWLAFRTGLNYTHVRAEDSRGSSVNLGLNFRNNIFELNGVLEITPYNVGYYSSRVVIVPYLAVGAGAFAFNPKTERNGEIINLQPLGTEGQGIVGNEPLYNRLAIAYPFGVCIRFIRNDNVSVGVEILGRVLSTDYIDDVSGTEIRVGDILDNRGEEVLNISNPRLSSNTNPDLTYRRGGFFNDFYYVASLTVSWRIQRGNTVYRPGKKGVICPRF